MIKMLEHKNNENEAVGLCVQPRPRSAANMTLPTFAAERRSMLSIDIFCLRGAQQQSRRTPLYTAVDRWGRQTDRRTIRYEMLRCYINVRSKPNMSQLNLPHGTDN